MEGKLIIMQSTITYINALVKAKDKDAILFANWVNSYEIETMDNYLILR